MGLIERKTAARLGQQTVAILDAGGYDGPAGRVELDLASAVAGVRSYPPSVAVGLPTGERNADTVFEVINETTLQAGRRLAASCPPSELLLLNFASAKNPGGGFLGGARAQEESLARSSGLFATLDGHPMYEHHRAQRDPIYTDWMLTSPAVPFFRTDEGALLDRPWTAGVLTAPAVNAKVVLGRDPSRTAEVGAIMARRIERVLAIAATEGYRSLVLGAWGCGAFGNDPAVIAPLFGAALHGLFAGMFDRVVFAVLDWTKDLRIIGPFEATFAGDSASTERE